MKLSLLIIPALVLMSCGQLLPSKKNPYEMKSSAVTVGACSTFQPGFNTGGSNLSGFSACTTADTSSVVIRSGMGVTSSPVCAYPATDSAISLVGKCFTPTSGDTVLQWPGVSFNSIVLILQQDKAGLETVGFNAGSNVPYSIAKVR